MCAGRTRRKQKTTAHTSNCPAESSTESTSLSRIPGLKYSNCSTAAAWSRSRPGPLPVALWMKMWNFIVDPPTKPVREGGGWDRDRKERRGGGQVPGAPCDGTPHRHGDMGQGARGEGFAGRARALSCGAAGLWHELPARWAAALGMLEERSRTQWPSKRTHSLSQQQQQGSVCAKLVTTAILHLAQIQVHTHTLMHTWRGWIRSASLVKQDSSLRSRALNTNYSH